MSEALGKIEKGIRARLNGVYNAGDRDFYNGRVNMAEQNSSLYEASQPESRKTIMNISVLDLKEIDVINKEDGGIPRIVADIVGNVAVVRSTHNMGMLSEANTSMVLPVTFEWTGPQSVPGSGIFSLTKATDIPETIVAGDYEFDMPEIPVSLHHFGFGEKGNEIAHAVDTIISVSNFTPIPGDNDTHSKSYEWALKANASGKLEDMSTKDILSRAIKIIDPPEKKQEVDIVQQFRQAMAEFG